MCYTKFGKNHSDGYNSFRKCYDFDFICVCTYNSQGIARDLIKLCTLVQKVFGEKGRGIDKLGNFVDFGARF